MRAAVVGSSNPRGVLRHRLVPFLLIIINRSLRSYVYLCNAHCGDRNLHVAHTVRVGDPASACSVLATVRCCVQSRAAAQALST